MEPPERLRLLALTRPFHRSSWDTQTYRFGATRLDYFEEFGDVRDAIAREKQLKGWVRSRKVKQILRACGAQDDRQVRSAQGKGRNGTTLPPLLSFSLS